MSSDGTKYFDANLTTESTDVSEMFETVSERYATDGSSASVTLKCPWEKRSAVANQVLTSGYGWDLSPELLRIGARYPDESEGAGGVTGTLEAQSVSIKPLLTDYTADGQKIKYKQALVTIEYASNEPQVSYQITSEYMTLNPAGFFWKYTQNGETKKMQVAPAEAPGILMHSHILEVSRRRVMLAGINFTAYEGHVNTTAIGSALLKYEYPAGTLLFNAPTLRKHQNCDGAYYDVTLNFAYRETGWNKFFNPLCDGSTLAEQTMVLCDSGWKEISVFPNADFKPLFASLGVSVDDRVWNTADNTEELPLE